MENKKKSVLKASHEWKHHRVGNQRYLIKMRFCFEQANDFLLVFVKTIY